MMLATVLPWHSLRTRLTLGTLGIFLVTIWSLSFVSTSLLQRDVMRSLAEQQASAVSLFAAHVDGELKHRLTGLQVIADAAAPAMKQGPAAIQSFLESRTTFKYLFNLGGRAYRPERTVVARLSPAEPSHESGEIGGATVSAALKAGQAVIGRPKMGKEHGHALFDMAAPIRNETGQIVGVLSGAIDLGTSSFLDPIKEARYGKSGSYLIVAPESRLILSAVGADAPLNTLPATALDRLTGDDERPRLMVDERGEEMLVTTKAIPAARWLLAAALPSAEAFAPVNDLRQRTRVATWLLSILAVALTWWILRRQLAALTAAAGALAAAAKNNRPIPRLPVSSRDEIGQLVSAFNQLLAVLQQRERELEAGEARFRQILQDIAAVAVQGYGPDTSTHYWNKASERLYGYTAEEAVGRSLLDLIIPHEMREAVRAAIDRMFETGQPIPAGELSLMRKDGSRVAVYSSHAHVQVPGRPPEMFCLDVDLTEFKKTEGALREREQSLQALLDNFPFMVWLKDCDSRFTAVNRAFASAFGRPSTESVIGRTDFDLTASDLAERYRADDLSVLTTGTPKHVEELIEHAGQRTWFETYKSPISVDGRLIGIVGFARDITERKRTELALRESETDLRHAQAIGRIGSWRLDVQRNTLRWSPENHRIFGIAEGSTLTYQTFLSCVHPDDRERVDREWAAALQGSPYDIEHRILVAGDIYWVRERAELECDSAGQLLGGFGTTQDVTERKVAQAVLADSEARFRATFEQAAVGIAHIAPYGRWLRVNRKFCSILGYSREELIGLTIRAIADSDNFAADQHQVSQLLARQIEGFTVERRFKRKGGEPIWVSVTGSLVSEQDGAVEDYFVVVVEDISSRKAAEAALKRGYDELELRVAERTAEAEARARELYESERFARATIDALSSHLCVLDEHGNIIATNKAWDGFAAANGARPPAVGTGANYLAVCDGAARAQPPGKGAAAVARGIRAVLAGKRDVYFREYDCHGPAEQRWFVVRITRFAGSGERRLLVKHEDVTARKRAVQVQQESTRRLARLTAHLSTVREEQSRTIAREVHDELGGTLTMLKLGLAVLKESPPAPDSLPARIEAMIDQADTAIQAVKRISASLRPAMLDTLGLSATIRWQADEFSRRTGIRTEVDVPEEFDLPSARSIAVYRIVQEALTNVARHAGATLVQISMRTQNRQLALEVHDNGRGLGEQGLRKTDSFGIIGMRERAQYLGGQLTVSAPHGKGTTLRLRLPLDETLQTT
jgi:PAS domain S-box-containing protein